MSSCYTYQQVGFFPPFCCINMLFTCIHMTEEEEDALVGQPYWALFREEREYVGWVSQELSRGETHMARNLGGPFANSPWGTGPLLRSPGGPEFCQYPCA